MLCPKCGTDVGDALSLCSKCLEAENIRTAEIKAQQESLRESRPAPSRASIPFSGHLQNPVVLVSIGAAAFLLLILCVIAGAERLGISPDNRYLMTEDKYDEALRKLDEAQHIPPAMKEQMKKAVEYSRDHPEAALAAQEMHRIHQDEYQKIFSQNPSMQKRMPRRAPMDDQLKRIMEKQRAIDEERYRNKYGRAFQGMSKEEAAREQRKMTETLFGR